MGKKHSNPKPITDPKSPDIFQTLFGEITQNPTSSSLFSDDNPFRRKPTTNPPIGELQNPNNDVEGKKRKRIKEKGGVFDTELASGGVGVVGITEMKKKSKSGDDLEELKKGKEKKRKRGEVEVEAEYEGRRYGELVAKDERGLEGGVLVVGEKRKTLDNVEDMVSSRDGFDDEDKLLRTVFVGNLPLKVKKKALLREFSLFGEVDSVRIRSVPIVNTKTPRKGAIIKKQLNDSVDSVHAYIVFKTEESAQASLSHNMAVVGGNHIRVDRACPPHKKLKGENDLLYDSKRTVFIGNLPFDVKDEEIYQLFSGVNDLGSSIEAIRVIRDPGTSMGKGIAYVLFKTKDAANMIVKKRNLKIRDRDLRLYRSNPNSTPSKRKSLPPSEQNKSPAKKFVTDSRTPASKEKTPSYQGLRASKSGVQKKVHVKRAEMKFQSSTPKAPKPKERSGKRPSVAARKENALKGSVGGGLKQTGKKRKVEARTPDSSHKNKKARKFR